MVHKKKYYIFSLVLLFGMLFASISTCYARTTLTEDEFNYIVNAGLTYSVDNKYYPNLSYTNNSSFRGYLDLDNMKLLLKNAFNDNNDMEFNSNLSDFFGYWVHYYDQNKWYFRFYYTHANFGKNDDYNHVYIKFNPDISLPRSSYPINILFIDDNKELATQHFNCIEIIYSNSTLTYNRFYSGTFSTGTNYPFLFDNGINNWNSEYVSTSKIDFIRGIISFYNTNSVYTNFDGVNFYTNPTNKLLLTQYTNSGIGGGDIPSIPEDTGNTGTITDSERANYTEMLIYLEYKTE